MAGTDADDSLGRAKPDSGWSLLAQYDGAPALLDAVLRLDPESAYTKTELGEAAGVAYKTLYLSGVVEVFVDVGLLEKHDSDGKEATFSVNAESAIYDAAGAFDEAVTRRLQFESERTKC